MLYGVSAQSEAWLYLTPSTRPDLFPARELWSATGVNREKFVTVYANKQTAALVLRRGMTAHRYEFVLDETRAFDDPGATEPALLLRVTDVAPNDLPPIHPSTEVDQGGDFDTRQPTRKHLATLSGRLPIIQAAAKNMMSIAATYSLGRPFKMDHSVPSNLPTFEVGGSIVWCNNMYKYLQKTGTGTLSAFSALDMARFYDSTELLPYDRIVRAFVRQHNDGQLELLWWHPSIEEARVRDQIRQFNSKVSPSDSGFSTDPDVWAQFKGQTAAPGSQEESDPEDSDAEEWLDGQRYFDAVEELP
ncbi:MAG: hypothetical protein M1833_001923 [Piccolia ochrophora]|nr:MAG: hypothetical protein M1833_001923 [Piccolia ochrophora]